VQDTIQGMNRIRDQVQDSAKRIKRLGESSQEIGEIVQLISDIADRTSILALNASIQAAMAGDAGQGFAVVAEEVERLAERSNEATKQIAALIKAIQGETSEAIAAMEESTREVVSGSTLAVQAGEALEEIDEVSSRLDELIHSISLATKQQARGAEALSRSMNEISGVTKQTAEGTKQAARAVGGMAALAEELRSSVSAFKLPEDHGRMTQSLVDLRAEELMRLPEAIGAGR
jgi:methyl-accepting chemotaxis protein